MTSTLDSVAVQPLPASIQASVSLAHFKTHLEKVRYKSIRSIENYMDNIYIHIFVHIDDMMIIDDYMIIYLYTHSHTFYDGSGCVCFIE